MQEMVYLKVIQKSAPMGVSVSGTTDQKTYLKNFRGGSAPLAPPGSAYDLGGLSCTTVQLTRLIKVDSCCLLDLATVVSITRIVKNAWSLRKHETSTPALRFGVECCDCYVRDWQETRLNYVSTLDEIWDKTDSLQLNYNNQETIRR